MKKQITLKKRRKKRIRNWRKCRLNKDLLDFIQKLCNSKEDLKKVYTNF